MCVVKSPKITPGTEKPKEPTIIRNPYLDGVDPVTKALRSGRSSLRIDRARPATATPAASAMAPPVPGGGAAMAASPWAAAKITRTT